MRVYTITEPRSAKTHPPCEKRTWGKNRAREKFAYQIPSQALELQQEKPPTPTKLVLGVCVYHFGHDLIAIDQRETALGGWEQHFYSYDGLGSVRALTDSSGQQTDTYTYDAFGIELTSTGTTPNAYRYTGEQFDEDLGQYYLRARYNDPNTGRFWSMDSYEGNSIEPLTLHKYLYAHSNSVNFTDPSGNAISIVLSSIQTFVLSNFIRLAAASPVIAAGVRLFGRVNIFQIVRFYRNVIGISVQNSPRLRPLLQQAQAQYPKLTGFQNHHILPIQLANRLAELGVKVPPHIANVTVRIPASYHRLITNEIAIQFPRGVDALGNTKAFSIHPANFQAVLRALEKVYEKYPLP